MVSGRGCLQSLVTRAGLVLLLLMDQWDHCRHRHRQLCFLARLHKIIIISKPRLSVYLLPMNLIVAVEFVAEPFSPALSLVSLASGLMFQGTVFQRRKFSVYSYKTSKYVSFFVPQCEIKQALLEYIKAENEKVRRLIEEL